MASSLVIWIFVIERFY